MHDDAGVETTRVERTFAFLDLSGFTSFTDRNGDGAATALLRTFREVVRGAASAHGVRIAKWLGDGAMLVGVESAPLVAAVADIERRINDTPDALPLRAGISSGPVILFEGDDYIGHAVNMAARLCDAAAPSGVLATVDALATVPGDVVVEPAGEYRIRGVEEPVPLMRLQAGP